MIYAVIDIETVENERAHEYFMTKKYEPGKNLKDPKKIEQDILAKRNNDLEKAALHWWSGRVICACINFHGIDIKPKTFFGDNEKELLCQIFDCLEGTQLSNGQIKIIGKSADTFDKPFLIGRALCHDIGIPSCLRPYRPIDDIDHIFGFSSMAGQRSNLNNYAMGLNIQQKIATGAAVKDMYLEVQMGDKDAWKKIYSYCAMDTDIVSEMLRRWLKDYVVRTPVTAAPKPVIEKINEELSQDLEIPF